jgi:erythromycin esterase
MTQLRPTRRAIVASAVMALSAGRSFAAAGGGEEARFIDWAQGAAKPLDNDRLLAGVSGARLVALGEFTHGAHEPLALRNRLIGLLAQRGMIGAVALESGFIEGRRLNAYVMGGPGDAATVARRFLTWGFGHFAENVELLEQLRRFNARPGVSKVSLFGMDMPGGDDRTMGDGAIAVSDAIAYLTTAATPGASQLVASLRPFSHDLSCAGYFARTPAEREALGEAAARLVGYIGANRDALINASSAEETAWAEQGAHLFRRLVAMFQAWPSDNVAGETPNGMFPPSQIRDKAMADNALWLLDRLAPSRGMLVFAANGHVWPQPSLEPMYPGFPGPLTNLGQYLKARLGAGMKVIVTGAGAKPPGAGGKPNSADTLAGALARVGPDAFMLDVCNAPSPSWIDRPHDFGDNMGAPYVMRPRKAFDVVAFFPRTSRAIAASQVG